MGDTLLFDAHYARPEDSITCTQEERMSYKITCNECGEVVHPHEVMLTFLEVHQCPPKLYSDHSNCFKAGECEHGYARIGCIYLSAGSTAPIEVEACKHCKDVKLQYMGEV